MEVVTAFGLVYLFWGSTYLGIGIAVEQFLRSHVRHAFPDRRHGHARLLRLTGRRVRFPRANSAHLAAVGILLLMGGNLTLSYAEDRFPPDWPRSLISVTPLWFLVLDSLLLGDHHISRRGKIGLAIGIVGIIVLIWPDLPVIPVCLAAGQLAWSLALPLGSFSWAFGSVLSKKWQTAAPIRSAQSRGRSPSRESRESVFALAVDGTLRSDLDGPRCRRHPLSRRLRLLDRLHRLRGCCSTFPHRKFQPTPTSIPSSSPFFWARSSSTSAIDHYILTGSAMIECTSVVLVTSAKVSHRAMPKISPHRNCRRLITSRKTMGLFLVCLRVVDHIDHPARMENTDFLIACRAEMSPASAPAPIPELRTPSRDRRLPPPSAHIFFQDWFLAAPPAPRWRKAFLPSSETPQ